MQESLMQERKCTFTPEDYDRWRRERGYLSPDELVCPEGQNEEKEQWLNNLIVRQRERIVEGHRPQLPRGLSSEMMERWRRNIHDLWLNSLSPAERRGILATPEDEPDWRWIKFENRSDG